MTVKITIKDYILKKCSRVHEFENIFDKYFIIFLLILIQSKQIIQRDRISINKVKLKDFDFNLEKVLKFHEKEEYIEIKM